MQTRPLGNTGLELSAIGLGTWALGGGDWKFSWGPQEDADSIRTIHRALDLGINWIDTAAVYGLGHSEEIIGRALSGMHQRPLVATKCERCWEPDGRIVPRLKRQSVLAEAEASLRRLGVDVLDLYQIHWPQPDEDIEEAWETMADLIRVGKVRFGGVSNFSVSQLQRIQPIHLVASLQPPYSLLARDAEAELLPYCAHQGIGVVVYSPLQKGLLTGKVTAPWVAALPPDDHRHNDPNFHEPQLSRNLALIEKLRGIAVASGKTLPELAIAWVLRRPEVTAAIVGARRPEQIEQTIGGADWQLDESQLAQIEQGQPER